MNAIRQWCTRCGARPGEACRSARGGRTTTHAARVRAANSERTHR